MFDLKPVFADVFLLRVLYQRGLKRAGRLVVGLGINAAFSLLSAYLLVNLFQAYRLGESSLLGMLFAVAVVLNFFTEFVNIINTNIAGNIFSPGAVVIFPVSRGELFVRMFINDLAGIRLVYYLAPAVVTLYFSRVFPGGSLPVSASALLIFYLLGTLFYTASEYLYALVKYRYGGDADKIITYSIFVIVAGTSIAARYGLVRVPDPGRLALRVIHLMIGGHAAGV